MSYTVIGQVAAAGNSNSSRQYYFNDPSTVNNVVYYRIKIIDVSGQFKYSDIIRFQAGKAGLTFWPNPFISNLHLVFDENINGPVKATLLDVTGCKIISYQKNITGQTWDINAGNLPIAAGTYILNVILAIRI